MIYSVIVALIYSLLYSIAILFTKYKANQRLNEHKRRKSTIRSGLIAHQQNMSTNEARIDELHPTNPTKPPTTPNKVANTTNNKRRLSESVDLTQLNQQLYTSVPYGAPVSNWECSIAILHSVDAGLNNTRNISLHLIRVYIYIYIINRSSFGIIS